MNLSTSQLSYTKTHLLLALFNLLLVGLLLAVMQGMGSAEILQTTTEANATVNLALLASILTLISCMAWFVWFTRRTES